MIPSLCDSVLEMTRFTYVHTLRTSVCWSCQIDFDLTCLSPISNHESHVDTFPQLSQVICVPHLLVLRLKASLCRIVLTFQCRVDAVFCTIKSETRVVLQFHKRPAVSGKKDQMCRQYILYSVCSEFNLTHTDTSDLEKFNSAKMYSIP